MQPEDLPSGWAIAGYDGPTEWVDVENGGKFPDDLDLEYADQTVLSFTDIDGEKHYYTVHGGFDQDYPVTDAIADLEEEYGIG
jgi:hypothetical protein